MDVNAERRVAQVLTGAIRPLKQKEEYEGWFQDCCTVAASIGVPYRDNIRARFDANDGGPAAGNAAAAILNRAYYDRWSQSIRKSCLIGKAPENRAADIVTQDVLITAFQLLRHFRQIWGDHDQQSMDDKATDFHTHPFSRNSSKTLDEWISHKHSLCIQIDEFIPVAARERNMRRVLLALMPDSFSTTVTRLRTAQPPMGWEAIRDSLLDWDKEGAKKHEEEQQGQKILLTKIEQLEGVFEDQQQIFLANSQNNDQSSGSGGASRKTMKKAKATKGVNQLVKKVLVNMVKKDATKIGNARPTKFDPKNAKTANNFKKGCWCCGSADHSRGKECKLMQIWGSSTPQGRTFKAKRPHLFA